METISSTLHKELRMRKICSNVVPKVLLPGQKQLREELCEDWLAADAESGILNRVMTGGES